MCFRPAQVEMNKCPKCGHANKPIAKVCENCGEPLQMKKVGFDADADMLDAANTYQAPSAPGAPKAPSAPGAPKSPSVPGAPQAPGAPKAPGAPQS